MSVDILEKYIKTYKELQQNGEKSLNEVVLKSKKKIDTTTQTYKETLTILQKNGFQSVQEFAWLNAKIGMLYTLWQTAKATGQTEVNKILEKATQFSKLSFTEADFQILMKFEKELDEIFKNLPPTSPNESSNYDDD